MADEDSDYEVMPASGGFEVISPGGMSVLVTPDENNARHYATLLTAAWRAAR